MKTVTIEAIRINPELLAVLQARARRARSEAVHSLAARLFKRLAPRLDARPRGLRWG